MKPQELILSDVPWAVAWYGDRRCVCTTINSKYEFFQFNDHVKRVNGLYLSMDTIDGKIFSQCINGGAGNFQQFFLRDDPVDQAPRFRLLRGERQS